MRKLWRFAIMLVIVVGGYHAGVGAESLKEQNEILLTKLKRVHGLSDSQLAAVRAIFAGSPYIGQGNPAVTQHPATPQECEAKLKRLSIDYENPEYERICGARYMAPLYDPTKEAAKDAKVCIDQFEFPDIPCEYPVVWVRAREAAQICTAMGKRICDARS